MSLQFTIIMKQYSGRKIKGSRACPALSGRNSCTTCMHLKQYSLCSGQLRQGGNDFAAHQLPPGIIQLQITLRQKQLNALIAAPIICITLSFS